MSDVKEFNEEQEFDNIMAAVAGNDHAALDKLMETELKQDDAVKANSEEAVDELPTGDEQAAASEQATEVVETTGEAAQEAVEEDKTAAELLALRNEVHKLRSDAGRVPFTQRRIKELENEVATLRATKAAASATPGSEKVELDPETQAVIDELRDVDPVMAKALETVARKSAAAAATKVASAFDEYSRTTQESEDERYFAEQYGLLTSQIPQAPQIFASPEWKAWKSSLSPNRLAMAESVHADEVATAIHAFAADMQRLQPQHQGQQQAPAAPAAVVDEAAQRAIQERNRKVAQAAGVPASAARSTEEFDEEKAYLEMFDKIAKANHIK